MKKLLTSLTLTAGLLGLAMSSASAAVLVYEGFDYTAGEDLETQSGGTGWGANNWTTGGAGSDSTISSGSLSFGSLVTNGNSVADDQPALNADNRAFGTSYGSGTVWFSMLMNVSSLGDGSGDIRYGLATNGTESKIRFYSTNFSDNGTAGDTSDDTADWSLSLGGSPFITSTESIALGSTVFMAVKVDFDSNGSNDNVTWWIDPTPGSTAPSLASAIGSNNANDFGSLTGVENFARDGATLFMDEIRLGDSYGDVAPIPEPSAAALLLGGLAAFLLVRRRR